MRVIRVVQIGIGHDHAVDAFRTLKKQTDIYEIAGYYVPPVEAEKYPERMHVFDGTPALTPEQILADDTVEAVVIETEEVSLTDWALACARAGKHIQMDKPGGLDPDAHEEMLRTAKQKGLVFHTGYMYRYNAGVAEVMERVRRGELGEIFSVEAHMDCRHGPEKRQWLETFPGGMMFFLGCHLVDLIVGILGTPEEIIPMNLSTGIDGVTADDYGFARRQLVVTGARGSLELKPLEMYPAGSTRLYTDRTLYTDPGWTNLGERVRCEPQDRYEAMFAAFAAMVRGERENPWSYEYELKLYRTVLAACGVEIDYKKDIVL